MDAFQAPAARARGWSWNIGALVVHASISAEGLTFAVPVSLPVATLLLLGMAAILLARRQEEEQEELAALQEPPPVPVLAQQGA